MALRNKIGVDLRRDFSGAIRVFLGEADPFYRRVARRHFAAEQTDTPATDDGEADILGGIFHMLSPARFFTLSSAMPEIVSLVNGRSTGSLRSADKSAAL